jgi:hypothetical protein
VANPRLLYVPKLCSFSSLLPPERLSLPLLVFRVFAGDPDNALAFEYLAVTAYFFDR